MKVLNCVTGKDIEFVFPLRSVRKLVSDWCRRSYNLCRPINGDCVFRAKRRATHTLLNRSKGVGDCEWLSTMSIKRF